MGNSFDFDVAARVQNAARVCVAFDIGFGFGIGVGNVDANHAAARGFGIGISTLIDNGAIPIIVV